MRKFINYYDDTLPQQIKATSYTYDHEFVGNGYEYYKNGNLKSIEYYSTDSMGIPRSRRDYLFFTEDDFLNGLNLQQGDPFSVAMEKEKLMLEYYENGKPKKEIKYNKEVKQVCLFRYREDGSLYLKAGLKYGVLSKEQINKYANMQAVSSFFIEMTFGSLGAVWYYDGIYCEYGTNGFETKKKYQYGSLTD